MGFLDFLTDKNKDDDKMLEKIVRATVGSPPGADGIVPKGYKFVDFGDVHFTDGDSDWAQYTYIYEDKDGNRIEVKKWGLI